MTIAEIEKMYENRNWQIRLEAVKLCRGRDDVPPSLIERFYGDEEWGVRSFASKNFQKKGYAL